jgi:hypothetical protein
MSSLKVNCGKITAILLWWCVFYVLFVRPDAYAQSSSPVVAPANDAQLRPLENIAEVFESKIHLETYGFHSNPPKVTIETTQAICMFSARDNQVRLSRYTEVPEADRDVFDQQAMLSRTFVSGEDFFNQSFYRFFFVHELGHWVSIRVAQERHDAGWPEARKQMSQHLWQQELEANRISVAYWREQDPEYLGRLMSAFRSILRTWPNPVPPGTGIADYFNGDYQKTSPDAKSFSWFQLTSALQAYDEKPVQTFERLIQSLPQENYGIRLHPLPN